ncbi:MULTISPECIES: MucB/RseB C-terminal domain-containing protein [Methylococcus]|uniref:MucB/RseB C-terminal domain-containing protein n=1 Tax=Methylococcus capsulatus TaxID=414 RepID=A0ABZ2F5B2_METCP|nr:MULTISPECIES: MucB/RseB C-terminal domain-containing protein [Methylococcus]MDF9391594.1 transcriptional regulator [Methylococcus capsulatus]
MFRVRVIAAALGAAVAFEHPQPSLADDAPQTLGGRAGVEWLTGMRDAMSRLNYRGLVAYLKDEKVNSMEFVHGMSNGIEHERLTSLNSPMREIVRDGDRVRFFFPETKSVMTERVPLNRSFLVDLPESFVGLCDYYAFLVGDQEYVAQRHAQAIEIVPVDDYRYGRKVWIDTESHLPLRFELLDENGKPIEQMVFTSLEVSSDAPGLEVAPAAASDSYSEQSSKREIIPIEAMDWSLDTVPVGFRISGYSRVQHPPLKHPIEHILLSDGLSSVSIYVDEPKDEPFLEKPNKIGAVNAYARKIDGFVVTVMGEVPPKTVHMIANGIRHQKSKE